MQLCIGNIVIKKKGPLTLICGPCVIENKEHTFYCAEFLQALCQKLGVQLIFKASFDKANRSSIHSFRGPGIEKGLEILNEVKQKFSIPVTADIHLPSQVPLAKEVLDLIQIPAFLCRQTDLLLSAAESTKPVNVKKGQFLAPWDVENIIEKIHSTGNRNIIITDRGVTFGYNNLVSDFRAIPYLQSLGVYVCYDASHSIQLPGGKGKKSGGQSQYIPPLAKAAIGAGTDLIFLEAHPNPAKALSDASSVYPFDKLAILVKQLATLYQTVIQL